jgi:hypothetical protein
MSLLSTVGALVLALPAGAAVITPTGTSYTINNTPGMDNTDPHVDGNLVSYNNFDGTISTLHTYDLSSRTDATIPNSGSFDFLSDVNAGRVAFTRVTPSASDIALYDTTMTVPTLTILDDPGGSARRRDAGIGANNVIWTEYDLAAGGSQIVVYNLVTGTTTSLGDPTVANETPRISPDGTVVTWTSRTALTGPAAVYDAVYTGGSWVTHLITADGRCSNPDTNGVIVVYACDRSSSSSSIGDLVYFQPVGGGSEQTINAVGIEEAPSVAGNFIAFAGAASTAVVHQLYVAELTGGATPTWDGNVYQLTSTTGDVELNDIAQEADLSLTVVWQQQDANEGVYGFNFKPQTAPSVPGAPTLTAGGSPQNTGTFTLGWSPARDPEGDPVTYTLEQKSNGGSYAVVASGLTSNSYQFTPSSPEGEGTWSFRVKALDSDGDASDYAETLNLVVVDRTPPNPPTLTPDTTRAQSPSYIDASGITWYKDSELVDVTANGDPPLADGSPGSGVDSSSFPATTLATTNGTSSVLQAVNDLAGNESTPATLTAHVDATPPSVQFIGCPTTPIPVGIARPVDWAASDGESGLASPASGQVTLNTATVGSRTVTTTATDNVGHTATATCKYTVVYNFRGFFGLSPSGYNHVAPGALVAITFSLDGPPVLGQADPFGTGVLAPGSPTLQPIIWTTGAPVGGATSLSQTALHYLGNIDVYLYQWTVPLQPPKPPCMRLTFKFNDAFNGPGPPSSPMTKSVSFIK